MHSRNVDGAATAKLLRVDQPAALNQMQRNARLGVSAKLMPVANPLQYAARL